MNKSKKTGVIVALILVVIIIIAAALILPSIYKKFIKANTNVNSKTYLYIPSNASYQQVLDSIKKNSLLVNEESFLSLAKDRGLSEKFKSGKYPFVKDMNNRQILNMLIAGNQEPVSVSFRNIRLKENFAATVAKKLECDSLSIIKLLDSTAYVSQFGFTTNNVYTMFIPNSYEFYWNTSADKLADKLAKEYKRFWTPQRLQKALDMILTGKQLRASQAKKAGLVDEVVAQSILLDAAVKRALKGKPQRELPALNLVGKVLERTPFGRNVVFSQARKQTLKKTQGNFPAPLKILDVIKVGVDSGMQAGLDAEAKAFGQLCMTSESAALRSIFFATTQMKKESGAGDTKPNKVRKAAVLGGGLMGGGIANVTATKAGVPVRIKDINQQGISNAMKYSYSLLEKKLRKRFVTKTEV